MGIIIKNCNLISMSEKRDKIEYGVDILIEDGKIKQIGKIDESYNKVIDATGKIVMPGLINTHAHISMSIFRETVDGLSLHDWLNNKIWPMEDKLTTEDIYWATLLSCYEMISSGCTTINDMYFMTDDIIKAVLDSGVRIQTTRTLMGNDPNDLSRLKELKRLLKTYHDFETISFNCGIHGFYTSSLDYIRKCIDFAEDNKLNIHIHFCEDANERKTILDSYKISTPAELVRDEFRGIHNILAHSVKLSDEDIKILKDTNSFVAHCPISNLKLGCGVAPISKMLKEGICVSLGTDGQGSGTNLDMFEVMKATALLQKGINESPEIITSYDVLKMATINGAKTLGLDSTIGSIDEGKSADIIIIDNDSIYTKPTNDIFSQIVYNTKGSDVLTTIVNGNILMNNKKIKNLNKDEIINRCNEIIERISV